MAMAVSWIAWRTPEQVREAWRPYSDECWEWHPRRSRVGFDGPCDPKYSLEQRKPPNLWSLKLDEYLVGCCIDAFASRVTVETAQADLWRKLRRGALEATAIERTTSTRVAIPVGAWDDLDLIKENEKDVLQRIRPWSPHNVRYDDVDFASAEVRELWPRLPQRMDQPPPMASFAGPGLTPLFCAAQWIATRGGRIDVGWDFVTWKAAYAELLASIGAGRVELLGTRNGVRERVNGSHAAGCSVVYPFDDHCAAGLTLGSDVVLFSCPFDDEVRWTDGVDDHLRDENGRRWSKLVVRKEQIAAVWPFHRPAEVVDVETYRTGGPGRPSSAHLVMGEFEKCCRRGEILDTLAAQARELEAWLIKTHPRSAPLKSNRIATLIREAYWPARRAAK